MNKRTIIAALVLAGLLTVGQQGWAAEGDVCNVVWDSPSTDSLGSMPLGNGDIGVNVWAEKDTDSGKSVTGNPVAD